MTDQEKNAEISEMLMEHRELRRSIGCLNRKIRGRLNDIRAISELLEGNRNGHLHNDQAFSIETPLEGHGATRSVTWPTPTEIQSLLDERQHLKERFSGLEAEIRNAGFGEYLPQGVGPSTP